MERCDVIHCLAHEFDITYSVPRTYSCQELPDGRLGVMWLCISLVSLNSYGLSVQPD